jgi:hypothetical protein
VSFQPSASVASLLFGSVILGLLSCLEHFDWSKPVHVVVGVAGNANAWVDFGHEAKRLFFSANVTDNQLFPP